ncbi:MAG: zinc-dependent metalloprotease, partial [Acidobacteriia bacterium]|nr:zinc-dependent metalloprotease [Terriglobia bacterium]
QREALRLALQALKPEELEISPAVWHSLVQYENQGPNPEAYRSSAGYVFSPYDGARSIAETIFDGLIDVQRLERLNSIHHFEASAPSAGEIISALVQNTFPAAGSTKNSELSGVVQNELADRLMILAADDNAPPEVSADAWTGVEQIHAKLQGTTTARTAENAALKRKIEMFLRDPKRNVPKVKPSGAPAGPPI